MSIFTNHPWSVGVGIAIAGALLLLLGGRCLMVFASWLQLRVIVRSGRKVTWRDAMGRCKAESGVIVVEPKSRPRRVWFLSGGVESTFFSRKGKPRSKGLLVVDPPDASRISEEAKENGGRVVEIDMNGTFW